MNEFQFKPLAEKDLELLYQWFQEPTIQKWYVRGQPCSMEDIKHQYLPRISGEENVPGYIVYQYHEPIGFIQYYLVAKHLPEEVSEEPRLISSALFKDFDREKLVGIDCFIAQSENRGRGMGIQMINRFIATLPKDIHAVLVDPTIDNQQSIRCYEKAGFTHTQYSEDKNILILIKTLIPLLQDTP